MIKVNLFIVATKWHLMDNAKNVAIFGVDNSSSSHTVNHKNWLIILTTILALQSMNLVLILVKQKQSFV